MIASKDYLNNSNPQGEHKSNYSSPILELDIGKYLPQFDCYDMSEKEKIDCLEALWELMCRFVEMGFNSYDEELPKKQNN